MNKSIKINMGCGWRNFGKDWIHIDSGNYEHLDYSSITELKQFSNESVDLIYASHVVEYFDREQVNDLLQEWMRVLKLGGILRIAVPNFEEISRLYTSGEYPLENFVGLLYGKMPMGEETIYHKTVYDYNSLKRKLEENKFTNIGLYDWKTTEHSEFDDHSQAYLPHMDKENGILMSLNVECKK